MIQDVEELRAELQLQLLRELEVLERREIDGLQTWSIESVASRISHEHSASHSGSRCKTTGVEIVHSAVNRVASRHEVSVVHGEVPVKAGVERISASTGGYSEGRAASCR